MLVLAAAYAIGCINTGYYFVRWKTGLDLRSFGSGNAGATNAGRLLGPASYGLALLGDSAKGALAVLAARLAGGSSGICATAMLAVVAGHIWPAQLGFHGGKGVATAGGALLALDPSLAGLILGLCVALATGTRRRAFSVIAALAAGSFLAVWIRSADPIAPAVGVLAGLMAWTHRHNLRAELRPRTVNSSRSPAP